MEEISEECKCFTPPSHGGYMTKLAHEKFRGHTAGIQGLLRLRCLIELWQLKWMRMDNKWCQVLATSSDSIQPTAGCGVVVVVVQSPSVMVLHSILLIWRNKKDYLGITMLYATVLQMHSLAQGRVPRRYYNRLFKCPTCLSRAGEFCCPGPFKRDTQPATCKGRSQNLCSIWYSPNVWERDP